MKPVLKETTGVAYARAGLLGNPGDAYAGKALAISVCNFSARVTLRPASHFAILRGPAESLEFGSLGDGLRALREQGCYDGVRLLRAALLRFANHVSLSALSEDDPRLRFELCYATDIPRQAGLSGSSAIIIAALRALARWFDRPIAPHELAEIALAAEVEDLGIAAGPMDRVIQAYEGVVLMDFSGPGFPDCYRRIAAQSLPPLFLAWDPRVGVASGVVHRNVRRLWEQGDPKVREAMASFRRLVDEGMSCLECGDLEGFRKRVDQNFDTRASIFELAERDLEMVRIGRAHAAAVKFAGSGGAVVGVLREAGDFAAIAEAYRCAGYGIVRPLLTPPDRDGSAE